MTVAAKITGFTLQEFHLHAADTTGQVARLVAALSGGLEPAVPLLTSLDDERDVATVRALHAGEEDDDPTRERDSLDRLVASWRPAARYLPRITERSTSPSLRYRLAVTGSGINDADPDPIAAIPRGVERDEAATPVGLLWIGAPVGTHAGLLILVGSGEAHSIRPDPRDWPLPLSRFLGVRMYASR